MTTVFALMAGLWGLGAVLRTPFSLRWGMVGAVWLAVVALQLTLPDPHPLRVATGGDPRAWLAVGVVAGLVVGYRKLLGSWRNRAAPVEAQQPGAFRAAELDRYSRHILLRELEQAVHLHFDARRNFDGALEGTQLGGRYDAVGNCHFGRERDQRQRERSILPAGQPIVGVQHVRQRTGHAGALRIGADDGRQALPDR